MANITRSALDALSLTNFPNNTSQLISPADLRAWLESGVDSFLTQKDINTLENALYEAEGSALAASATVNLASATGNFLHITGTGTINSFGTCPAGSRFVLVFDGVCTLVYNAISLIIPGNSNKITAVNDTCMVISEGSGNWRIVNYFAGTGTGLGTVTQVDTGTGLTGGPITGTGTISLANTAVTPNSYTNANITVDPQGRITAASNGSPGGVTSVTASAPLSSTGGTTPDISIPQANGSTDGFLDSSDWTTFNGKQDALSAGTGISLTSNTVTNTAPDQTVALTAGTGIGVTGTYPNFTISNTSTGGSPLGLDTQIQYNNGGVFGGVSDLTWDDVNNVLTINTPRIGQSTGNGHFHMHTINATPPSGLIDYITLWVDKSPKQVGYRFEQDTYTSAFQFNATVDRTYTFPDLSGTVALLANPASFSSLTSTSNVTIGNPSATTGTIVLHNSTNANTLTLQSGTTSASYAVTLPPAAATGAQYLQTTGAGGVLQWTSGTTTGVSSIGTIDVAVKSANGAVVSGSNLIMQTADTSFPGLVSTGTQSFAGNKSFSSGVLSLSNSGSNWILYNNSGFNNPTVSTIKSTGTKIVLGNYSSATQLDYGFGLGLNTMWMSLASESDTFQIWFAISSVATNVFSLNINAISFRGSSITLNTNTTSANVTGSQNTGIISRNFINFGNGGGSANPATVGSSWLSRSLGSRLIIQSTSSTGQADMAIGYNTNVFWHSLFRNNVDNQFSWYGATTEIMRLGGTGILNLATTAGRLQINSLQVVGTQIGGWGAPTATPLRAALTNASTATDVLQTLAALIVDLRTHGLIAN